MRVLIDTNVIISAVLFLNSVPYHAYIKATNEPYDGMICEQNVEALKRIFNKKFPNKISSLDKFLSNAFLTLELVPVPNKKLKLEMQIRDEKDRLILRAAIKAKADIVLSGDKDFLESSIKKPAIMSPAQFLNL